MYSKTFMTEITPSNASYENKLLKLMMKYNGAKLVKAVKCFNYNRMQAFLENCSS